MPETVINICGLGKRYRLGMTLGHDTLRDQIAHAARRIVSAVRGPNGRACSATASRTGHASDLPRRRQEFWALKDIHLEVKRGEILGVIGRNGAGKSTLLKILSKITEPTLGEIRLRGRMGSLLEVGTGMHPELSGRENVYLNGAILGMAKREIDRKYDQILDFSGIREFMHTPIKRYSSGMRVRLGFAIAAHLDTEILLIDEVLAVGDVSFQRQCLGKMESITNQGRTVIFVSHDMSAVQGLCSRVCLIDNGRLVADGSADRMIHAYLSRQAQHAAMPVEERKDRKGNGKVRFRRVHFRSGSDTPAERSLSGEPLKIAVDYSSAERADLSDLVIHISFYNSTGQFMFTCASDGSGHHFSKMPPRGRVWCEIPKLPLAPGQYTFNLYSKVQGQLADWVLSAGSLTVLEGDFFGTGKLVTHKEGFLVEQSWRHNR